MHLIFVHSLVLRSLAPATTLLMLTLVAEVLSHERIQRFSDYRSLVIAAIKKKDSTDGGTPTPSIPKVSDSGA